LASLANDLPIAEAVKDLPDVAVTFGRENWLGGTVPLTVVALLLALALLRRGRCQGVVLADQSTKQGDRQRLCEELHHDVVTEEPYVTRSMRLYPRSFEHRAADSFRRCSRSISSPSTLCIVIPIAATA
jgi:hypothetical protein